MTYPNDLVGKTLTNVQISTDRMAIRFLFTDADPVIAKCDADCCSGTWIEYIDHPAGGYPAYIVSVIDLDLPNATESDDSLTQRYGLCIVTQRGAITIEYRNESNGYYGGNLCWPGQRHYGGVYGQNISTEIWE